MSPHFLKPSHLLLVLLVTAVRAAPLAQEDAGTPNILLIMVDDMGYSDPGCMGGEIDTPSIDSLAKNGMLFTSCYNSAKCTTTRASLMTGLYHQQCYSRSTGLDSASTTIPEALRAKGYRTAIAGKWHLSGLKSTRWFLPEALPTSHGFDEFYGISWGCSSYFDPRSLCREGRNISVEDPKNYYFTDAIAEEACAQIERFGSNHFFQYVAFTGPHFPLHIPADDPNLPKYRERYQAGWDQLREQRFERQVAAGLLPGGMNYSSTDPEVIPWKQEANKEWEIERMAVYAAMLERVDTGISKIISKLKERGVLENTLIVFLSDNGATEAQAWVPNMALKGKATADGRPYRLGEKPSILPGPDDTYQSIGRGWAHTLNTPLRNYKISSFEGGTRTPMIVHWPKGGIRKGMDHQPIRIIDFFPTFVAAAHGNDPDTKGSPAETYTGDGQSFLPALYGEVLPEKGWYNFFKDGGCHRKGPWKIVTASVETPNWELYNLGVDWAEAQNLASQKPEMLDAMKKSYYEWQASFPQTSPKKKKGKK